MTYCPAATSARMSASSVVHCTKLGRSDGASLRHACMRPVGRSASHARLARQRAKLACGTPNREARLQREGVRERHARGKVWEVWMRHQRPRRAVVTSTAVLVTSGPAYV